MNGVQDQTVVGLGEVLWDCFDTGRKPGGAPANVAFQAQQLGHVGVICSCVGRDERGKELLDLFAARGLQTSGIQRDPEHPTGWVTVDTSDPHRPSYVIHENVAWDHLRFVPELDELMRRASAVCFGTLAQRGPVTRDTIRKCLAACPDALVVYDINLRQRWYQRDWIEESLRFAHIVKLNVDEVAVLVELLATGSDDPVAFAHILCDRFDIQMVCITRAEDGCLLAGRDETIDVPGSAVEVADAVGAGDAFAAAMISARLRGWGWAQTAEFANGVGGLVASHAGAMPVLVDELQTLVDRTHARGHG